MGHARALLSLASLEQQRELSARIVAQKLSVRETERLVALKLGEKPGRESLVKSATSQHPHMSSPWQKNSRRRWDKGHYQRKFAAGNRKDRDRILFSGRPRQALRTS